MPSTPFDNSRTQFPDLPSKLIEFFDHRNAPVELSVMRPKSVQDFLSSLGSNGGNPLPQPSTITEITRRLARHGWLSEISFGGMAGLDNRYLGMLRDPATGSVAAVSRLLNCGVYGFSAVYDAYSGSVLPMVNWDEQDDQQIGTCFIIDERAIATALHCVKPAKILSIRDINSASLKRATFFTHPNEALDLSLIVFPETVMQGQAPIPLPTAAGKILDEVMALGYPNVPGFHPTLAAEAANISGRLTASRGRIASQPAEIFSQAELFLITARVRGGFSGGPILDTYGQAVGVVSREPATDGNSGGGARYDQLGYGTAIPADGINEMIDLIQAGSLPPLDMAGVSFRDFE